MRGTRNLFVYFAALAIPACLGFPAAAQGVGDAVPTAQYIGVLREEARRADGVEFPPQVRRRWQYVIALAPNDPEAAGRLRELDAQIAARAAVLVEEGNAEMRRGRAAPARAAYLKALALDGANAQARSQLAELDRRAQLARQDRANQSARAALIESEQAAADRNPIPELLRAPPQRP
jgi:hypothetical protein